MEFPTRWVKIFKDIWGNKSRAMLVVVSIAVGVAAIGMINNTMSMLERDLFGIYHVGNPSSISIYTSPFEPELANVVEDIREIESAQARRTVSANILGADYKEPISLVSMPDFNHVRVNRYNVEQGTGIPGIREIVLERQGAIDLDIQLGDTLIIETLDEQQHSLLVTGIVHDLYSLPYNIRHETTGYVSIETLQWMGQSSFYSQLDIVVAENGLDRDHVFAVAALVRDRVLEPAGYHVGAFRIPGINAGPGQHWAQNSINGFMLVLQVMGILAIFLSGGLVVNTISAILSQQIRQIGIMRSVGAVRRQLIGMYLLNMLVFSVLGLALGLPLGMFGAWRLTLFAASYLNFNISAITPDPVVTLLQIGVGFVMPLGVALLPILGGTRISVYDAIYQYGLASEAEDSHFDVLMSKLRNMHPPVMLSLRNTFRKKARLIFTLITLTLAGAMFMSVFSTRASLTEQINQVSRYVAFDAALGLRGGVSRVTAIREARRIPGVTVAEVWVSSSALIMNPDGSEGESLQIIGVPYDIETIEPIILAGRWLQADDTQQIVINDDLLEIEPDIQVGDKLTLKINEQQRTYEVVGILSKHLSGGRAYMTYGGFTKATGRSNQADSIRVRHNTEMLEAPRDQRLLADSLSAHFQDSGLSGGGADTQAEVFSDFTGPFDIILVILVIMACLLAVVGGLSLTGTMGMNVMERTREIGVLRAVGANNTAVRQVVVIEGVVVALISWLLAVIISYPTGMALAGAVVQAVLKADLSYQYSMQGLLLWLMVVVFIGVVASLAPAQSAVRLTVREVLDYE